jgi:hypothetical protein
MMNFNFSFRGLRVVYVMVLAFGIYLAAEFFPPWVPALISLLAIFDIVIDKEVYNTYNETDESIEDERGYGPGS